MKIGRRMPFALLDQIEIVTVGSGPIVIRTSPAAGMPANRQVVHLGYMRRQFDARFRIPVPLQPQSHLGTIQRLPVDELCERLTRMINQPIEQIGEHLLV